MPNHSPMLDKTCAPLGPDISSSIGAGVWRNRSGEFPDSKSVLDKFLSARGVFGLWGNNLANLTPQK